MLTLIKKMFIVPIKKILKTILPSFFIEAYKKRALFFYDKEFIEYVSDKKSSFELSKSSIKVLSVRGSNADFGFDTNEISDSFNLGLTSSDFFTAFYIYNLNRHSLISLKYIFVYLSPASIGFELIKTKEKYRAIAYKYYFDIPYDDSFVESSKVETKILNKCIDLKGKKNSSLNSYRGYIPKKGSHEIIPAALRAKTHMRENLRTPDQIEWLKRLVSAGESDGVKVLLVITPFRSDYKKHLPGSSEVFSKIYNNFNSDIILDFYDSELFNDADLYDTDHLNSDGAKKLTKLLKEELKI